MAVSASKLNAQREPCICALPVIVPTRQKHISTACTTHVPGTLPNKPSTHCAGVSLQPNQQAPICHLHGGLQEKSLKATSLRTLPGTQELASTSATL